MSAHSPADAGRPSRRGPARPTLEVVPRAFDPGTGRDAWSPTGLEDLRLTHRAFPGRAIASVSLETALLGSHLAAPVLLAADGLTPAHAAELTRVAAARGLGLVVAAGAAPGALAGGRPPLVLVRLPLRAAAGKDGPAEAARAVAGAGGDALVLEVDDFANALDGEAAAGADALEVLAAVAGALAPLPVLVSGGGLGLDAGDVRAACRAGIAGVDVDGAGGGPGPRFDGASLGCAMAFSGWGVPTADAVVEARLAGPGLTILASGGLRDGVDAAKCLALGADAVCLRGPVGAAAAGGWALEGTDEVLHQLTVAVWAAGAASAAGLGPGHLRADGLI